MDSPEAHEGNEYQISAPIRSSNDGIDLLKDLRKDFQASYKEHGTMHLTISGVLGILRKLDLIIDELER